MAQEPTAIRAAFAFEPDAPCRVTRCTGDKPLRVHIHRAFAKGHDDDDDKDVDDDDNSDLLCIRRVSWRRWVVSEWITSRRRSSRRPKYTTKAHRVGQRILGLSN